MGEKIVVFGGAGFIGSHVADYLSDKGYKVVIFDQRPSEYLRKDQEMIVADVLDLGSVQKAVEGATYVYDFAGISNIDEAKEKPLETIKVNVLGNANILHACHLAKVKRVIFASSLYVYSQAGSFYRSSKQACELIIENYNKLYGLDFTVLRYGSLYGKRASANNAISRILKQALTEGKIVRHGDGEEVREYINIEDAARISVEILSEEFRNEYVLITGHHPMKVKDLLTMVREIIGSHVAIEYHDVADGTCPYDPETHYKITPYSYSPRIGKKLVSHYYLDFGQGLLDCLSELQKELNGSMESIKVVERSKNG